MTVLLCLCLWGMTSKLRAILQNSCIGNSTPKTTVLEAKAFGKVFMSWGSIFMNRLMLPWLSESNPAHLLSILFHERAEPLLPSKNLPQENTVVKTPFGNRAPPGIKIGDIFIFYFPDSRTMRKFKIPYAFSSFHIRLQQQMD